MTNKELKKELEKEILEKIDPKKLSILAKLFEFIDEDLQTGNSEIQDDLNEWADLLIKYKQLEES